MARKVTAQEASQRRKGVNRAQLKAIAAQQAMSTAAAQRPIAAESDDLADTAVLTTRAGVAARRRQVFLTPEQEFVYIRDDLRRLVLVASVLLVVLLVTLYLLR